MAFYGTPATGRGLDRSPRSTSRRWARTASRRRRSGPGPTASSPSRPGVELVLEAFDGYWRKTPSVKRLVFKARPGRRHAAGHAQARRGRHRLRRHRRARRGGAAHAGAHAAADAVLATHWLLFADQWDASSPWHDRRVRLAATHAVDRQADQPGRDPRLLQDHREHHPHQLRLLLAAAAPSLRSAPRPGSSSRRPGTRRASTPATSGATPAAAPTPSRSSTTSWPSASGRGCARSSARGS